MPPQCCRCNGNGHCRGCVCVRSNRPCTNCLPRHHGWCENLGDDSPNGITDGAQLEPPEPPVIHQSELPPAEYDSEHTESEQRNGTVRCVREGTNGRDGIDVGDGSMPNNRSSDVEFANDQTSQSANMLSADHTDPWLLPCSPCPDFQWESSDGKVFCASITSAYDEAIHWKRNIFLLPSGNAGKSFIQEMTRLFNAFADGSTMKSVALKASFVMQMLLLQKPIKRSKAKDHISHLKRRLELWKQGNIEALVQEGKCIENSSSTRLDHLTMMPSHAILEE